MSSNKGPMVFRAYMLYFGFVLVMFVGLYKMFKLQWTTEEVDLPVRLEDRAPRMGEILDANLNPLMTSVSYFDIHMDPTVVDQKIFDEEVSNLAEGLSSMYGDKSVPLEHKVLGIYSFGKKLPMRNENELMHFRFLSWAG